MTYPGPRVGPRQGADAGRRARERRDRELTFSIPAERRAETTALELSLQPSLALMLLDALPYLVDFPYGCTEQTTSRFIPAAIVAKVLGDAGVTLEDIAGARGGVAKQRETRPRARALDRRAPGRRPRRPRPPRLDAARRRRVRLVEGRPLVALPDRVRPPGAR